MQKNSGMHYVPEGKTERVVDEGEFIFASAFLDHGHIKGQTKGLIGAGGTLKYVYDKVPDRAAEFSKDFPNVEIVDSFERILDDESIDLVAAAAVPNKRGPIGLEVMDAGKDYFTDKAPFTSLEQLESARLKVNETGCKYLVYYGERLHNESAWKAGELIKEGAVGRVLQVINIAPHRLAASTRPEWFFVKEKYGGILIDIGSHQFEQFLDYSGANDAEIKFARVANFGNPEYPELEDFGEASLIMDTGTSCYCRVDWFTPNGLNAWGDGRTFVLGTEGTIEVRKYLDVGRDSSGDIIFLTDGVSEKEIRCSGQIGFPAFGMLILDVLNRTETFMTQHHAFKAAELSLRAQEMAIS
ncbi:MAG: scyllo-inositol 2-dehydrogenase (NADP(+)) IolW [Candidatus Moanabacter tarae]|uniref:Scyllo-inositol 2-dehydrogenase (NADP(+)) IolW n=1 Tax=Candidatus Moanibacter tarae TaxID=2200854 RepID=A0A2Z4AE98_9BACT|nr:MAG: scyllo-inositol 2-dehydrogenase (NADP(+)) IolW [Candidatus Moanabacter tarae]